MAISPLWGVKPPPALPMSYIRLLVVKAQKEATVARLGPVLGINTHWTGEKTVACVGAKHCPHHSKPVTWKGYCPGVVVHFHYGTKQQRWRRCVLVVTPEITASVDAWPAGRPFVIARPGAKANGPLEFWESNQPQIDPVPESFSVIPYVLRAMNLPANFDCVLRITG